VLLIIFVWLSPQMVAGCQAAAGFSVGEITALVFTGALSLETGKPHNQSFMEWYEGKRWSKLIDYPCCW